MKTWEYKTDTMPARLGGFEGRMNRFGQKGWELVSVCMGGVELIAFYKREIVE